MQKHTKIYMDYFGYGIDDFIPCEMCGAKAVDIHHITPRSKFGRNTEDKMNTIDNLIALCRNCHNMAHGEDYTKNELHDIHILKL